MKLNLYIYFVLEFFVSMEEDKKVSAEEVHVFFFNYFKFYSTNYLIY